MATKKKDVKKASTKKGARSAGGAKLEWHPRTFEDARDHVFYARAPSKAPSALLRQLGAHLAQAMPTAIQAQGPLACPPPAKDAQGKYQVGLDKNSVPEIQKLNDAGEWTTA
jgi:hypothetical protein